MSELSKRWAVAVVAIPMVLGVAYLGGWFIGVPLAAFAAWATHELYRMAGEKGLRALQPLGWLGAAALVLLASWKVDFVAFAPWGLGLLFILTTSALLGAMAWRGPEGRPLGVAAVTVLGVLYAGLLSFLPLLQALGARAGAGGEVGGAMTGLLVLLLPLACTWIGDAAAFFAGSAWGRAKLAPSISPNKSWVGFWANLAGAAVAAALWGLFAAPFVPAFATTSIVVFTSMGAFVGLAAVLGDLTESLLKREAGVKDSGTFFPGHGGVLDRIDSILFTVPTAYACLWLLSVLP